MRINCQRPGIYLEELTPANAELLHEAIQENRSHLSPFMGDHVIFMSVLENVRNFLDSAGRPFRSFGVFEEEPGTEPDFCGQISVYQIGKATAEIGYWVARRKVGQGIASLAVSTICESLSTNTKTVKARVKQGNVASQRVLRKNGFSETYPGHVNSQGLILFSKSLTD